MEPDQKPSSSFAPTIIFAIVFGTVAGLILLFISQSAPVSGFSQIKSPPIKEEISHGNTLTMEFLDESTKVTVEPEDSVSTFTQDTTKQIPSQETETPEITTSSNDPIEERVITPQIFNPYKKQFIALSFDGSYSLSRWADLLAFSNEQKLNGTNIHFTFFVSGIYLLEDARKYEYTAPRMNPGQSNIGFGGDAEEIKKRIAFMEQASQAGHEIASHANGHYDGGTWSYEEWLDEFNQFENFTAVANIPPVKGFRAPQLRTNKATYQALRDVGQVYDASGVAKKDKRPWKDEFDIWHFPLVFLTIGGKKTLSMDYNHYYVQTGEQDILKKGTPEWQKMYDEVYSTYMDYFEYNYSGNRIPLNIGHHFSLWNDGLYYEVLLDFAKTVCAKSDVICGTYTELVDLLEGNSL